LDEMSVPLYVKNRVDALKQETRRSIYSLITMSPGLHFREIQRRTGMASGQCTYHLDRLQKVGLVKASVDGNHVRYYPHAGMDGRERRVLELARQKSVRHILLYLLRFGRLNHEQLANSLGLSQSTVTWHLSRLVEGRIIDKEVLGRKSFYSVNDPPLVKMIITKYRASFLVKLVDRFADMWEI
jgi:predicted transcriptional regulator